jgi:hypothetical protein
MLRQRMHSQRRNRPLKDFDFGPAREAYHARWPAAMHDAISAVVQEMPLVQRQVSYRALYQEVDRMIDAGETVTPDQVPALLARIQSAPRRPAPKVAGMPLGPCRREER